MIQPAAPPILSRPESAHAAEPGLAAVIRQEQPAIRGIFRGGRE